MTLEIRELVIKAVIGEEAGEQPPTGSDAASGASEEELVQQCVERVLAILKEQQER